VRESHANLFDLEMEFLELGIEWRIRYLEKSIENTLKEHEYEQRQRRIDTWKAEWYKGIAQKTEEMQTLHRRYVEDPKSITVEDWENMANGSEKMIAFVLTKHFPKKTWPEGVPYLDLIARHKYLKEKEEAKKLNDLAERVAEAKTRRDEFDREDEKLMEMRERQEFRREEVEGNKTQREDASEGDLDVLKRHEVLGG
jgi:hypothetical protein